MPPAKKTLRAPILKKDLPRKELEGLDDVDLERCRLEACTLSGERGERVRFDGVCVAGGSLSETKVSLLHWLDVLCERCDLSMIEWKESKLTRVELRECRITGAKLAEAELDEVRFVECQLDYVTFSRARFRQVSFERCRLKESDFSGADLGGTSFVACEMQGVDLSRAKLQGADVSSSNLGEVRVGAGDVRGLVVNREQATVLAQLFGLVLRDEP